MAKKIIRFAAIAVAAVVLLAAAFWGVHTVRADRSELPSRLSWYHNTGEVALFVDGKRVDLDGNNIRLSLNGSTPCEYRKFQKDFFRFHRGAYGYNAVQFTVAAGEDTIPVYAEYFSANNWHVNHFYISISINTDEESVEATGYVWTKTDPEPYEFTGVTIPLDDNAAIDIKAIGL